MLPVLLLLKQEKRLEMNYQKPLLEIYHVVIAVLSLVSPMWINMVEFLVRIHS